MLKDLIEIMEKLRADNGCQWDRAQTHDSLIPYAIEEAYEVASAIKENNIEQLKDELGDLLFQVIFHAQIAKENNEFNIEDVIESACNKIMRRHPHVFGDMSAQESNWEAIKAQERLDKMQDSVLADIPDVLPALYKWNKVFKRLKNKMSLEELYLDFDKFYKLYEAESEEKYIWARNLMITILAMISEVNFEVLFNEGFKELKISMDEYLQKNNINYMDLSPNDVKIIWNELKYKKT